MPTIVISAKATKQNDNLLFLELSYQSRIVEMTVRQDMTLLEMAQLAIEQPFPDLPSVVFDGDIQIDFHLDEDNHRIVDNAVKL